MFNKYPYTDFHEINLDWILHEIMRLHHDYDEFKAANTITNAGAWDITKQYQAWTVVSDNNTGYISLKPVPVGIDIHNAEYWGLIADYNILITDLSNRISALESDNASNKNRITALENKTAGKIIFIGDSYGTGEGPEPISTPYIEACAAMLGLTVNDDYYKNAMGGASWKGLNGRKSFKTLLEELDSTITNKNAISLIIVCGGVNDTAGSTSDIFSGAQTFATYAKSKYPNAKVVCGCIGWTVGYAGRNSIVNISQYAYKRLGAYGIGYINNSENLMHDYTGFQSDGIHPNQNGANIIAYGLSSFIRSGNCSISSELHALTVTKNSAFASNVNFTGYEHIKDNQIYLELATGIIDLQPGIHPVSTGEYLIGTINTSYINSINESMGSIPAIFQLNASDNSIYIAHGYLWIIDNNLKMRMYIPNSINTSLVTRIYPILTSKVFDSAVV